MLKLIKYEFRKALTAMLILLGGTLAAEVYFLYGMNVMEEKPEHLAISMIVLMLLSLAVYIFVLVRGVASYSGELKNRSSYLIFMTPNSTRKIMASKFLFTLILCVLFGGLYALLVHVIALVADALAAPPPPGAKIWFGPGFSIAISGLLLSPLVPLSAWLAARSSSPSLIP